MREDMFKVIVERPRLVNSNAYKEDGCQFHNCLKRWGLAPLCLHRMIASINLGVLEVPHPQFGKQVCQDGVLIEWGMCTGETKMHFRTHIYPAGIGAEFEFCFGLSDEQRDTQHCNSYTDQP